MSSKRDVEEQFKRLDQDTQKRTGQGKWVKADSIKETLERFIQCAKIPIMRERIVLVGCLETSQFILRAFRKLNFEPEAYYGVIKTFDREKADLAHVWVEVDNYVIEPNPSQVFGLGVLWLMERNEWRRRTQPEQIGLFKNHPLYAPTPQGEIYYNGLAEEVAYCMKGR